MMPYRGLRPETGWSLHMTGGWRAQWERVGRWHARIVNATEREDRQDFLYAFFESAFHLRDWLKDTRAVPARALDRFFKTVEMRLCRDIANERKHLSLTQPSQNEPPSELREYVPSGGNLAATESLMILSDGLKYDAFDLAHRIFQLWDAFLKVHTSEADRTL